MPKLNFILASDSPIDEWFFRLELDMDGMNAERVNAGVMPFLADHDFRALIGLVEELTPEETLVRGVAKSASNPKATEVWRDIDEEVRNGISVGFMIDKMLLVEASDSDPWDDLFRATEWTPYEASSVTIPADINAQVSRSMTETKVASSASMQPKVRRNVVLEAYEEHARASGLSEAEAKDWALRRFQRANVKGRITRFLSEGDTPTGGLVMDPQDQDNDQDRAGQDADPAGGAHAECVSREEFTQFRERVASVAFQPAGSYQVRAQEQARERPFEVGRLLELQLAPGNLRVEREAALEVVETEELKDKAQHGGVILSHRQMNDILGTFRSPKPLERADGMTQRASVLAGSWDSEIVDYTQAAQWLFDRAPILEMCTVLQADYGELVELPRATAVVTVDAIAEGADVTESAATRDTIQLVPKEVPVEQPLSRRAFRQPPTMAFFMEQIAMAIADYKVKMALIGTGTGNDPTGVLETTGITSLTDVAKGAVAWADTHLLQEALDLERIPEMGRAYVGGVKAYHLYQQETRDSAGGGGFVVGGFSDAHMINMYPSYQSTHLEEVVTGANNDKSHMIYGAWPELFLGLWGGVEIWADTTTHANKVTLRAYCEFDSVVRRTKAFSAYAVTGF